MISGRTKSSCAQWDSSDNVIYISRIMWVVSPPVSKWPLNIEKVMFILQLCRSTIILLQSMFSQIQFHNLSHFANSRLTSPAILDLFKLSKRKIIHTKTTTVFYALLDEEGEVNSFRAIKFLNIPWNIFFL